MQASNNNQNFDPIIFSKIIADFTEKAHSLLSTFLQQKPQQQIEFPYSSKMIEAFFDLSTKMMQNPTGAFQAQLELWQNYTKLYQATTQKMLGINQAIEPVITPIPTDKRFKDKAWQESIIFDFIKQSYLILSQWIHSSVQQTKGLDPKKAQQIDFFTRQFIDAIAPSNFALTNPEVIRTTLETKGQNLIKGFQNLLSDLEKSHDSLQISMTDKNAFELGKNIALTPGSVVYQNDLMQLIQYQPSTKQVYQRPLLIIPPWINKYYILDLQEKNSFVRWLVSQGFTVFMISWNNPDKKLANKNFENYMLEGPLTALNIIEKITDEKNINAIGYCLGGTLLACTLAYLENKNSSKKKNTKESFPKIVSATYLTTLVDFSEPGELGVFIDEQQIKDLEKQMNKKGYLEGHKMAYTFNMLRANDLIWSFVVNNYLLGKDPFPFDLLYWNSDSTRLPAAMHSFYLRKMYLQNLLAQPNGITLDNVPIDLRKIETPTFILSTKEDHIAPWQSTFKATKLYNGSIEFVLAASGHIAGVINPPNANKYEYWTNKLCPTADQWLKTAQSTPGSWWPHWANWAKKFSGKLEASPTKNKNIQIIEPAPGSYVKR
ncbi:MAG: class I poly(R)-hydroxyalkanoic acid synthase [Alphaproteobacteria bacterium]|nr:class I poly(R)-hydroxyalkanoic acid synthase [Alphaproteobacteria bacterium]